MEKTRFIEIPITGSKENIELLPENYGIREIIFIFENAENVLYLEDKKERPIISYNIEQGSVKQLLKTPIQFVGLVDYQPKYDDLYLEGLREKAKKSWLDEIYPDNWLKEIRGGYDA